MYSTSHNFPFQLYWHWQKWYSWNFGGLATNNKIDLTGSREKYFPTQKKKGRKYVLFIIFLWIQNSKYCSFASRPLLLPPLSYKTHSFRFMQFYYTLCPFPGTITNEMKAFVIWFSLPLHVKKSPAICRKDFSVPSKPSPLVPWPTQFQVTCCPLTTQIPTTRFVPQSLSPSTIALLPKILIQIPWILTTMASPFIWHVPHLPPNSALASLDHQPVDVPVMALPIQE